LKGPVRGIRKNSRGQERSERDHERVQSLKVTIMQMKKDRAEGVDTGIS
jgi:hypothetical protein